MVTMHILRGGMTPLQDIRLAPFVSVSQTGGDYTHKGDADSLTQPFCVQNAAYSLKTSTSYILPTRWYKLGTVLPDPISKFTGSIQGGVLSMVAPPECKNPVDVTTLIDKPWMKKNLWQMVRGKEGTEATANFVKHAFDSRCEFDANKAIWERVAASPYPVRRWFRLQSPFMQVLAAFHWSRRCQSQQSCFLVFAFRSLLAAGQREQRRQDAEAVHLGQAPLCHPALRGFQAQRRGSVPVGVLIRAQGRYHAAVVAADLTVGAEDAA